MEKDDNTYNGVNLPELIQDQSDEVKQLYSEWFKLGEKIKAHPFRWQHVPHKTNPEETIKIDLRQAWVVCSNQTKHLTDKERARLKALWSEIQLLKVKKGRLRMKWQKAGKNISTREVILRKSGDIIELFGKYKTIDEVVSIIKDWGYQVTRKQVHDFSIANKDKIAELRDEWSSNYEDFALAKKRGRVEKLAFLAKTQMDKYKEGARYSIAHSRELRAIYESIKKEIEGERIVFDIDGYVDPTLTIEANRTLAEVLRRVSLTNIVVSIVAAKRGIDPLQITAQLQNSIYARFSGAKSNQTNFDFEKHKPKQINETYDWIAIEKMHAEDVGYEEIVTTVPKANVKEINEKRDKLAELLALSKNSHIDNKGAIADE